MTTTMQAIVQHEYGGSSVLHLDSVARPEPGADEVLVAVRAAGLDRGTWHLMAGLPYVVRLGFGVRAPRNPVPGLDLSGTVVAVGSAVTRFSPGDDVFGIGKGSFAEYAVAKEAKLAMKPAGVSHESAASLPVSGLTALQAVRDVAGVVEGQHVLVIGASGGVGTFAVQLAKAAGARVTGVCSAAKADFVTSLGADHVIDYATEDFADGGNHYDVILDMGGNSPLKRLRTALAADGTLVIVGGEEGGRLIGGVDRQARALLLSTVSSQRLTAFLSKEKGEDIAELARLLAEGTIVAPVDRAFPLDQARAAMQRLEEGRVRGKAVITVG